MIFFSVIIPTYNRASLIGETIRSVLDQSYTGFEVIIVDDGSADHTRQVIETYFKDDSRIRYFYKTNEERGAARNFGMKKAQGDYAVFFDSDDWMQPHYLETLQQVIAANPGIFLVAAKYDYRNNGSTEVHPLLHPLAEGWYERSFFLEGNILACNYCIRLKETNPYPFPEERELASMEDWLFLLQNLGNQKIFIRDEVCVTMRQHEHRSMNDNQKVIEARKKATAWALKNLSLTPVESNNLQAWSYYFCGIHQYLDNNRVAALNETWHAIKTGGIKKEFLALLTKSLAGRKLIQAIR